MRGILIAAAAIGLAALAQPALGEVAYVGSSTIGENIIPEAARAFTAKTGIPFGRVEIQGSGKGLELVMRGEAQLAGLARALTTAEKQLRIHYQIIGYDAVAVFVHPTNPVTSLTRDQLKAVYTGRITSWKLLGGPDARIVLVTQIWGAKRAQMVEFQEHVMDGAPYREDRKEVDRQVGQVAALAAEKHGITAVSLAFTRPGIKPVSIEGFAPEPHNVRSGAYILSRPLILVAQPHPQGDVKRFFAFILSREGQAIVGRKFVPVR